MTFYRVNKYHQLGEKKCRFTTLCDNVNPSPVVQQLHQSLVESWQSSHGIYISACIYGPIVFTLVRCGTIVCIFTGAYISRFNQQRCMFYYKPLVILSMVFSAVLLSNTKHINKITVQRCVSYMISPFCRRYKL